MDQTVSRLVIDVVTDADKASQGFEQVAGDSKRMAADVEDSGKRAARGLSVTADGTDELASKSSQATGALGALSAGFELVGLEKYAGGLQAASMATDFMSGVGDSLNLVLESTRVQSAIARVNMIRQAAASRIVAGATRAQAVAQRVLNAVMRANPIGLIITAITIVVGLFVLAYRRSETFRSVVQAVGRAGRTAIGWIVARISDLVGWVKTTAPAAFRAMKSAAETAVRLATTPIRTLLGVIKDVVSWVKERLGSAFSGAKKGIVDAGNAILSPFKTILNTIKDIIEWVKKIKIPKIPKILGGGRVAGGDTLIGADTAVPYYASNTDAGRTGATVVYENHFHGAIDPLGTASTVAKVQAKQARLQGLVVI